jgi:PadR family transcriptional regulator, regulatory protein PadR
MDSDVQRDLFPGALECWRCERSKGQPRNGYALVQHIKKRVRIYELTPPGAKQLERELSKFERMLEGLTRVLATGDA